MAALTAWVLQADMRVVVERAKARMVGLGWARHCGCAGVGGSGVGSEEAAGSEGGEPQRAENVR